MWLPSPHQGWSGRKDEQEEVGDGKGSGSWAEAATVKKGKELSPTLAGRAGRIWPHCRRDPCALKCAKQTPVDTGEDLASSGGMSFSL